MPFEVGDDIVNDSDEYYLVEKMEIIRLPPDLPGGQGDIARYHYDIKKYNTGDKKTINIIVEENPYNNVDTMGTTWHKIVARGIKRKRTKRTKRRGKNQSKRTKTQRQSKRRRQSKE
jgi:hypothetical protein